MNSDGKHKLSKVSIEVDLRYWIFFVELLPVAQNSKGLTTDSKMECINPAEQ
jgi:hypothetical protein